MICGQQLAQAFPEMIKHGYVNCTACHVSPGGGGLLTSYGRSLSAEVISTWSQPNEEKWSHGLINTAAVDDWLALGGDYRGVQVHSDTLDNNGVHKVAGRFINMQMGIEIGILQPKWAVVAFVGQYNFSDPAHSNEVIIQNNRIYGLYKPTDELNVKIGRFQPQFGVNLPDHILSTRSSLIGMSPYSRNKIEDKTAIEMAWLGENYNFTISHYKVREDASSKNDQGYTLTMSKIFNETLKIGPQFLSEKNDNQEKLIYGIMGLLGWNEKWVTLVELNKTNTKISASGQETNGLAAFQRTSYEVHKGINVSFLNDYLQTNLDKATKIYKYGPGLIWYPRPHFDFQLFYTKEHRDSYAEPADTAWLMTHYYF